MDLNLDNEGLLIILEQEFKIDNNIYENNIKNKHYNSLKDHSNNLRLEYLKIINEIHSILLTYTNLTSIQKFNYCKVQRIYIKLFLKEQLLILSNI